MTETLWLLGLFCWVSVLVYHAATRLVTFIGLTVFIGTAFLDLHYTHENMIIGGAIYLAVFGLFGYAPIRRLWLTKWFFKRATSSQFFQADPTDVTTKLSLAGWERDLLTGVPDWSHLLASPMMQLNNAEMTFLKGPVNELIQAIDPWDISHNRHEIPPKIWQRLKRDGFFGLSIPTEYGGHGFTNYGLLAILQKIAAVSDVIAEIVGVANSLSATQLLIEHGTKSQQQHYLPRIAKGDAITCMGLINPESGVDLNATTDQGVVCESQYRGKTILGLQLQWQKRCIHLAPVATDIAVLVKIVDPERKLSKRTDLGLALVLMPSHTAGINIGRRHASLDGVMPSGPCTGQRVFVPLDHVIGETNQIGRGWELLQGALAKYHTVVIPACQLGRSKAVGAYTGVYARLRCHGQRPLSQLGGIAEKLAKITGLTYLIDAATRFGVDQIADSPLATVTPAITKYQVTELTRDLVNEAIEIQSSKATCLGPRNTISQAYQMTPENISAGGGNILLRSAMIIGAEGIHCHPHYSKLQHALQMSDKKAGFKQFDQQLAKIFWRFGSNKVRSFMLGISRGTLHWHTPKYCRRQFQMLMRLSSAFAIILDVYLLIFGRSLAKQQIHCGRLADCLSKLYLLSALLRNYHDAGQPKEDKPIMDSLCQSLAYEAEQTMVAIVRNTPKRFWRFWLRIVVFPFGTICKPTADKHIQPLATLISTPSDARNRLFVGLDFESLADHPLHKIHHTWQRYIAVEPLLARMYQGLHTAKLYTGVFERDLRHAKELGLITDAEVEMLSAVENDRREMLAVDDFAAAELNHLQRSSSRVSTSSPDLVGE